MSVIWISHDLGLVGRLADRVAVMYAGEIVELAPTAGSCSRSSQHPYTAGLIRSGTRLSYGERVRLCPRHGHRAGSLARGVSLPAPVRPGDRGLCVAHPSLEVRGPRRRCAASIL